MRGHVKKLWRESATLVLVARNQFLRSKFDYRVLLLERSSKSRFMPNREVFPGGVIDKCDFSDEWMNLYEQSFQKHGYDFSRILNVKGPRPPIFGPSHTSLPREIAFRICAIRETFEESGILLLKRISNNLQGSAVVPDGCGTVYEGLSDDDVRKWRAVVHNDGSQFVNLCRELQCVPDVWALSEWSDWLTPADMKIRFDTVFFMCFVFQEPHAQHDEKELVHSQWKTPIEAFMDVMQKKAILGPPQLYNALQFCRFTRWSEFKRFQELRAQEGCDVKLVIRLNCSNGELGVMPGDDLYPELHEDIVQKTDGEMGLPDGVPVKHVDDTIENLHAQAKALNRVEFLKDTKAASIRCNCLLGRGLPAPVSNPQELQELANVEQSKL